MTMRQAAALLLSLTVGRGQDLFLARNKAEFSAKDPDVIIIGAGWAGMAAADHLARANVSFVVLEASNRTGGRSKAINFGNPSVGTFVFEQGSNWVCGDGAGKFGKHVPTVHTNPVLELAKQEGLRTTLIPGATDGNMSNYFAVFDEHGHAADPTGALRRKANAALACLNKKGPDAKSKTTVRDGLEACGWSPKTNAEWAMDWAAVSDESGVIGKGQALAGFLPDASYDWWGPNDWFVVDQHPRGYARLIDAMVRDTVPSGDPRLIFDAHVTKIDWGEHGVAISTKDGRTFKGQHAISTLSLGVIRRHHEELFTPPLPEKQATDLMTNNMLMANLTHVLIQFPTVWWNNALPAWISANEGGRANKGLFTAWHNLNHDSMVPGSNTLLSFLGEPEASERLPLGSIP
jgi:monoamine oxidase